MWELDCKESWVLKNWCFWTVILEKTLESPLDCKEIKLVNTKRNQSWILIRSTSNTHWKGWCWSWSFNTLATWCKELTHWKRPWWWKRLKAGGEGDNRGWDGWMASLTQWTWVWASSRSWWWTGKPGVLQSTGLQRVRYDWVTELNWTDSLEGLMLKLKLQNCGYLMQRANTLEKTLMLGKTECWRKRGWQRMRWLDGINDSIDMNLNKLWGIVKDREAWHATIHRVAKSQIWFRAWTTTFLSY